MALKFRNHLAVAQIGLARRTIRKPYLNTFSLYVRRATRLPTTGILLPVTLYAVAMAWLPDAKAQKEAGRIVLIATLGRNTSLNLSSGARIGSDLDVRHNCANHRSPIISAEFATLARHLGPGPRM